MKTLPFFGWKKIASERVAFALPSPGGGIRTQVSTVPWLRRAELCSMVENAGGPPLTPRAMVARLACSAFHDVGLSRFATPVPTVDGAPVRLRLRDGRALASCPLAPPISAQKATDAFVPETFRRSGWSIVSNHLHAALHDEQQANSLDSSYALHSRGWSTRILIPVPGRWPQRR
jgi:hypothetical protein